MPKARPSQPQYKPVPVGEHFLTLHRVDEVETPNLYRTKKDEQGREVPDPDAPLTRTRWVWRFLSDAADGEGHPFEYVVWTGPTYGDERAGLTEMLDWLMPDASFDEKSNVDTGSLLGNRYRAKIKTRVNKKGNTVPDAAFMEPDATRPKDEEVAERAKVSAGVAESGSIDPDEIPF